MLWVSMPRSYMAVAASSPGAQDHDDSVRRPFTGWTHGAGGGSRSPQREPMMKPVVLSLVCVGAVGCCHSGSGALSLSYCRQCLGISKILLSSVNRFPTVPYSTPPRSSLKSIYGETASLPDVALACAALPSFPSGSAAVRPASSGSLAAACCAGSNLFAGERDTMPSKKRL